jgi:hypothetical protein
MTDAQWEHLASLPGGTVAGLAAADGVVFAATPAGIRRSANDGTTWAVAGLTSPVPFANVVAVSPEPKVVYAGGREGAYRSSDGGAQWQHVLGGGNVLALAVPSRDLVFAGTESDGVLRSEDGGRTWSGANPGLLDLTILALALSPSFAQDRIAFAATASGLYRTRNGGRSWRAVEVGSDDLAVQSLALSPRFAEDRVVLAGTEADGLLRSDDAGDSWQPVEALAGQGVTALAFSAHGAGAAAIEAGVALSDDLGASWRFTGNGLGPVLSLVYLPSGAMLAGLARHGVARSADGGTTWKIVDDGLRARLLVNLTWSGGTLCAADLQSGVIVSHDGGVKWHEIEDEPTHALAASPAGTLFAATVSRLRRGVDDGASWEALAGTPAAAPRALAYADSLIVAWADGALTRSDDDGRTWRAMPTPFGDDEVLALAVAQRGVIVVATRRAGEIVVWRSTDGWQRWLVQSGGADVVPLAVPPTHRIDGVVFVGLNGGVLRPARGAQEVRRGERRPMWRATALGDGSARVTALAVSPDYATDHTLVAATSGGVFVSRDAGEHFGAWSEGLSPLSVVSLAYPERRTVFALGLGGTVWRRSWV